MQPSLRVLIAGRPNVGKSSLFNCLTGSRDALVADHPGLTRDRKYGLCRHAGKHFTVIDTGGVFSNPSALEASMQEQVDLAMHEADVILFVVDARTGLTQGDRDLATMLRWRKAPTTLVANKCENANPHQIVGDFSELGLGDIFMISTAHRRGIHPLIEHITAQISEPQEGAESDDEQMMRIAVIGRPNTGKSTLINQLTGTNRVIASDQPGTTRDSIYIRFEKDGQPCQVIDTAGVRKRARVNEIIEKFSVFKALEALQKCTVAVILIDGTEGVTDQDSHLTGVASALKKSLLLAINKCDSLTAWQLEKAKQEADRRLLRFTPWAQHVSISALRGDGVAQLWKRVKKAHASRHRELSTSELNSVFAGLIKKHPPPRIGGRAIQMRYVHPGGHDPPTAVIHGNRLEHLPDSYRRYLENALREALALYGTPLKLLFRTSRNPYASRKDAVIKKQRAKRRHPTRLRSKEP